MRYMVFVKMRGDVGEAPAALQEVMGAEMGAAFAAGSMIDAGGLGGASQATEVAGGYAILEARSREEALEGARRVIEIHKEHWPGWEGAVEVRPITGPPED